MTQPAPIPFLFEHFAVAVCAISGVLAATGRRMDLFGVLVLALVTAVGGGTIRDLCLGVRPVFWVGDPSHVITATITAVAAFIIARFWHLPARALLVPDAFGLALFAIVGAEKTLMYESSWTIVIMLGVTTGVAGGILRDVLCREVPLIFQQGMHLYATAALCGCVVFLMVRHWLPQFEQARLVGMIVILAMRLISIRRGWNLPAFKPRERSS